jgi:hypothetical protein
MAAASSAAERSVSGRVRTATATVRLSLRGRTFRAPAIRLLMGITVEPCDGRELDRVVTALLNVTGIVHHVIETTERPLDADELDVVGLVAERLREELAPLAEHHADEELAFLTEALAEVTLVIAEGLGLGELFAQE